VIYRVRVRITGPTEFLKLLTLRRSLSGNEWVGVSQQMRQWLNWSVDVFEGIVFTKTSTRKVR
jgi:hypothetical protein